MKAGPGKARWAIAAKVLLALLLFTSSRVAVNGEDLRAVVSRTPVAPMQVAHGKRTVNDVVSHYAPSVEPVLREHFSRAGAHYPPRRMAFLAFKEERLLEVWVEENGRWLKVARYPIKAASGRAGPKLRQGDHQVPEGLYRLLWLNPNSQYHLSMKVDYPNAFDRAQARRDGRTELGGDIFIHGRAASIGCLAMGDAAIEELFVLVARTGAANVEVVIAPRDLRVRPAPNVPVPAWTSALYTRIAERLKAFRQ